MVADNRSNSNVSLGFEPSGENHTMEVKIDDGIHMATIYNSTPKTEINIDASTVYPSDSPRSTKKPFKAPKPILKPSRRSSTQD